MVTDKAGAWLKAAIEDGWQNEPRSCEAATGITSEQNGLN